MEGIKMNADEWLDEIEKAEAVCSSDPLDFLNQKIEEKEEEFWLRWKAGFLEDWMEEALIAAGILKPHNFES
jgi:hypothetical protein